MSSITVIVPALNEEGNIEQAVETVKPHLISCFDDYQVLIFDDGSSDSTGKIAENMATKDHHLQVIHNKKPMGLGYNYKNGVKMAKNDYLIMIPGDNDIRTDTYDHIFKMAGQKDIINTYSGNIEMRPWGRRLLSRSFTTIMNVLFGMDLRYFNGTVMHKKSLIQSISIDTDGFAYQAEALIKLIKSGATVMEVPHYNQARSYGTSKALHPKNVYRVLKSIITLFIKVRIKRQYHHPLVKS